MFKFARERLQFEKLDGPCAYEFDCGSEDQNQFLSHHAWDQQELATSVTYLLFYREDLAGYFSVCMDELRLAPSERPSGVKFAAVPALKLAQMGVGLNFQGDGLGQLLIARAGSNRFASKATCRMQTANDRCPAREERLVWAARLRREQKRPTVESQRLAEAPE